MWQLILLHQLGLLMRVIFYFSNVNKKLLGLFRSLNRSYVDENPFKTMKFSSICTKMFTSPVKYKLGFTIKYVYGETCHAF